MVMVGRANDVQNLTGLIVLGFVQAGWRAPVVTPNCVRFSFSMSTSCLGWTMDTTKACPQRHAVHVQHCMLSYC